MKVYVLPADAFGCGHGNITNHEHISYPVRCCIDGD